MLIMDKEPFCRLFHAMLRHSSDEAEKQRANGCMQWLSKNIGLLDKMIDRSESLLLSVICKAWRDGGATPTRDLLGRLCDELPETGALSQILKTYDARVHSFVTLAQDDMTHQLGIRKTDFEKAKIKRILETCNQIVDSGIDNPDPNLKKRQLKPRLIGVRDAIVYLQGKLEQGILIDDAGMVHGQITQNTFRLEDIYSENVIAKNSGRMFMPTGISAIDDHVGGNRRKDFNAILGYAGQRKSAVLRTMGYHAAMAGFRVMHIPLESDYDEEMIAYLIMHANGCDWGTDLAKVSSRDFDGGNLSEAQRKFLLGRIRRDFENTAAQNITIYPPKAGERTWAGVKAAIVQECLLNAVDLVLIDYLTILDPGGGSDRVAATNTMIIEAKQLALTANEGKGFCLVTPVQGNRKGYENACENDGAWAADGIHLFSEYEKSLDNCYYVYTDDTLSQVNELKFGSCKMRRHRNIASTFIKVNPRSGMVEDHIGQNFNNALSSAPGSYRSSTEPAVRQRREVIPGFS